MPTPRTQANTGDGSGYTKPRLQIGVYINRAAKKKKREILAIIVIMINILVTLRLLSIVIVIVTLVIHITVIFLEDPAERKTNN